MHLCLCACSVPGGQQGSSIYFTTQTQLLSIIRQRMHEQGETTIEFDGLGPAWAHVAWPESDKPHSPHRLVIASLCIDRSSLCLRLRVSRPSLLHLTSRRRLHLAVSGTRTANERETSCGCHTLRMCVPVIRLCCRLGAEHLFCLPFVLFFFLCFFFFSFFLFPVRVP